MAVTIKRPLEYDLQRTDTASSSFWIERIANESTRTEEFSTRYANATLYAYVKGGEQGLYNFTNKMLGYSFVTGDKKLSRVNPQAHPKIPNLYASRITTQAGIKYAGRVEGSPPTVQTGGLKEFADYDRELVMVEFGPPRFNIREDDDPDMNSSGTRKEWRRYVDYRVEPNIYDVTMQTGQFTYAEGTASNPSGKSFPGELNFLEVKTTFNLTWRLVPQDFIQDTDSYDFGYPTKLAAAAGHVNSASWAGYPAGTLLLLEPTIDPYLSGTLRSTDGRTPVYMCDVNLPIIHFNPPSYGGTYKGHNLKPWWKAGTSTLTYYLVTSDGTTSGIRIYGEYDFAKIFEHWSL